MRRRLSSAPLRALLVMMLVITAGLLQAGEFPVSGGSEYRETRSRLQAVQFLARATFGYTDADIESLAADIRARGHRRALSEWIDAQLALPPTLHETAVLDLLTDDGWTDPYTRPSGAPSNIDYRDFAWWQAALGAPDQLRQRTAFALMQILVINRDPNIFRSNAADSSVDGSGNNQPRYTGIVDYYDMLIEGAFGNYLDLLKGVTYHPVMGVFLTHINNEKPSADGLLLPDENFAREILQLFTMGEYRTDSSGVLLRDRSGNLIQNYTNDDIKALARVFTGLQYAVGDGSTSVNLHDPMEIRNFNRHDFEEKVFPNLRYTLPARSASVNEANAEINEAVELCFQHPNVAPYLSRILIQRFVMANPSMAYIADVSAVFDDNGQGVRGDLGAVVKAILLHKDALRSQRYRRMRSGGQTVGLRVSTRGTEHCKLVEPILRYTQFIKMFGGAPVDAGNGIRLRPSSLDLSQLPYQAPSVFNYFRPDYQPPGYQNYRTSRRIPNGMLVSPENQIYTPVFANRFQNLIYRHTVNNVSSYNSIDFSNAYAAEKSLATSGMTAGADNTPDFSALLDRLDFLMCHGSLSEESKNEINAELIASGNSDPSEVARFAIMGVFGSSEAAIDE